MALTGAGAAPAAAPAPVAPRGGARPRARTGLLAAPMAALMLAGFLLPGLLMFASSLGAGVRPFSLQGELSWAKYAELAGSAYLWRVLGFTLAVSAGVALVNAVLAYPVAIFLARSRSRLNRLCFLITFTPVAVGMNMVTMGWLIVLGRNGVINSLLSMAGLTSEPLPLVYGMSAVVIGLAHISFTFMVLPIEAVLRTIDPALERAARSLGASRWRTFVDVTLPLSWEGVAAGMLIVFMQSCGAFVIPLLLGGSGTVMLPVSIWETMTVANDRAGGAAIAVALTLIALAILAVQLKYFNPLRDGDGR